MATADELNLTKGNVVRIGSPIYRIEPASSSLSFLNHSPKHRLTLEDCEIGEGPMVEVIDRDEKRGTLVEYLECWVDESGGIWKGERHWIHNRYIGFGKIII